jgi:hypothetical protein
MGAKFSNDERKDNFTEEEAVSYSVYNDEEKQVKPKNLVVLIGRKV